MTAPGPLFIAMLAFPSRDALGAAIGSAEFALSLGGRPPDLAFTGSSFERHFYPVGGATEPAPLTAPFSYVVRYHKPAEDEAAFIRNYVDTHPPTLAQAARHPRGDVLFPASHRGARACSRPTT